LFLSQVLDPDHSCRATVARLIVWLAINGRKPCSSRGKLVSRGGNWCQFIFLDPLPGVGVGSGLWGDCRGRSMRGWCITR
jgi:hypothetical protein